MGQSLTEIAQKLNASNKKMQLIYAFNGTGKTRLSREFKDLITPNNDYEGNDVDLEQSELATKNILYYSAFTEDLFYWDNDLDTDEERKLKIHPNSFTQWVFEDQGQDRNVIENFQRYTDEKLTPHFNEDFTEVRFSFERGNDEQESNIKISKGEESNFIWSVFFTLLDQVIDTLNIAEEDDRDTDKFNQLKYVFIDDPVSSLDESHLIELAVNLASLIKRSYFSEDGNNGLKFVITTHNPLFFNVLYNELGKAKKYTLKKYEDGSYDLNTQSTDSPFSYHLYLKSELEKAIESGNLHKYHYNFLRNILEKASTFLGYNKWGDLLPRTADGRVNPYEARVINISSHSKHASEEVTELTEDDKRVLGYLVEQINEMYRFKSSTV
jgi:wobble nucleotide-excising tRNase